MAETKNYKLYVTDDSTTNFQDFRRQLAGDTGSNMVKIDEILAGKSDTSKWLDGTLSAGAWVEADGGFTQELSVQGVTPESNGAARLPDTATEAEVDDASKSRLTVLSQENGTITVKAKYRPSGDIPVQIILFD